MIHVLIWVNLLAVMEKRILLIYGVRQLGNKRYFWCVSTGTKSKSEWVVLLSRWPQGTLKTLYVKSVTAESSHYSCGSFSLSNTHASRRIRPYGCAVSHVGSMSVTDAKLINQCLSLIPLQAEDLICHNSLLKLTSQWWLHIQHTLDAEWDQQAATMAAN